MKRMTQIARGAALGLALLTAPQAHAGTNILFGGDTHFGENYNNDDVLVIEGYQYTIENFASFLQQADAVVVNLETPITDLEESPVKGKSYLHWADPVLTPLHLLANNISIVSLANNHTLDYGVPGLDQTFSVLQAEGFERFGAGNDLTEAEAPWTRTFQIGNRSFTLVVIGAYEYRSSYDENYDWYASDTNPGAYTLSARDIGAQVAAIKDVTPDVFVVAFPHWGSNYNWKTSDQTEMGRELIDEWRVAIVTAAEVPRRLRGDAQHDVEMTFGFEGQIGGQRRPDGSAGEDLEERRIRRTDHHIDRGRGGCGEEGCGVLGLVGRALEGRGGEESDTRRGPRLEDAHCAGHRVPATRGGHAQAVGPRRHPHRDVNRSAVDEGRLPVRAHVEDAGAIAMLGGLTEARALTDELSRPPDEGSALLHPGGRRQSRRHPHPGREHLTGRDHRGQTDPRVDQGHAAEGPGLGAEAALGIEGEPVVGSNGAGERPEGDGYSQEPHRRSAHGRTLVWDAEPRKGVSRRAAVSPQGRKAMEMHRIFEAS